MDMEKLTKQQIVLVTLLVSFVTSIATGIVTVALMDQAPPGVTQTINRVVERTVERVVTPPATGNTAAVVTHETVVVKEDDKIVESVDKNKSSIVRIYTDTRNAENRVFVGLGTVISKEGLIVTGDVFADIQGRYVVMTDDNKIYHVSVVENKDTASRFYFLKVIQEDPKVPVVMSPVVLADSDKLKLGQTVIAWGGNSRNSVSTGIVSSLIDGEVKLPNATTTIKEITGIMTNNLLSDSIPGGPLLNLYGEVVGIRVSPNIASEYNFLPVNLLKREVVNL